MREDIGPVFRLRYKNSPLRKSVSKCVAIPGRLIYGQPLALAERGVFFYSLLLS